MDFDKLSLNRFQKIMVDNLPEKINLPFNPSKNNFDCLIAFVHTGEQVDDAIGRINELTSKTGLIFVYPKGTSKNYESLINRNDIINKIRVDK